MAPQLRNQDFAIAQTPASTLDIVQADGYRTDDQPGLMAKELPTVCNLMHKHQRSNPTVYGSVVNAVTASVANSQSVAEANDGSFFRISGAREGW